MRTPTVHRNGTSRAALSDGYLNAATVLQKALEELGETVPNARDYYPQGQGSFAEAQREHASRVDRLRSVWRELQALYEAVEAAP